MENFKKRTAYEILDTLEETLECYTEEENDKRIRERRDILKKGYEEQLEKTTDFNKRAKIEVNIGEVNEAYDMVGTAVKRKEYSRKLKYSHVSEYRTDLINTKKGTNDKMVEKEEGPSKEYSCIDKENRQLTLKRTGRINFQNWTGIGGLFIEEYEITRVIEGKERIDRVYTNLCLPNLRTEEETGKPIDVAYYDCVVNKLFSEYMIENSKYNSGYIGQIEQDEEGNYYTTLGKEKLNAREQEMLSAVMIMKQREENMKEEGEPNIK